MTQKNNHIHQEISQRLSFIINNKVASKKELAEILNIAPTTVSAWSKGRIFPSVPILIKIAILTHTSLDWLLLGKAEGQESNDIDEDIFNQVFEEGYKLANQYNLKLNGAYFLGLYSLVMLELEKTPNLTPSDIIKSKTKLILQLKQ